jgi:hypothetical protein
MITDKGDIFPIPCVGKDNRAAIFYVHSQGEVPEEGAGVVEFLVRTTAVAAPAGQDDGRFFLLRLEPVSNETWRIKHIDNQGFPEFNAAGIPEALLPALAEKYNIEIWSQPAGRRNDRANTGPILRGQHFNVEAGGQCERNDHATKMWGRLKERLDTFQVIHDENDDAYRLVRRPNQPET